MPTIKASPFSFHQFHIKEFSINREPVKDGKPNYDFNPSGYIDHVNGGYLLTVDVEVKDSNEAYIIKCRCIGSFKFKLENNNKIELGTFFYLNAPAIMFPYIRSYISSVTALSGLPAINLPLVNFPKAIGEKLKANTKESVVEEN